MRYRSDGVLRHQALQQTAHRRLQSYVDRHNPQLGVSVGRLNVKIHVVNADHLALVHVDHLLIEDILPDLEQSLIRRVATDQRRRNAGLNLPHRYGLHLVVGDAEDTVLRRFDVVGRHAKRVLAGGDGQVGQTAEILALRVKRRHSLELGKVDHSAPQSDSRSWKRVGLSYSQSLISGPASQPSSVKARCEPGIAAETARAPITPKSKTP